MTASAPTGHGAFPLLFDVAQQPDRAGSEKNVPAGHCKARLLATEPGRIADRTAVVLDDDYAQKPRPSSIPQ